MGVCLYVFYVWFYVCVWLLACRKRNNQRGPKIDLESRHAHANKPTHKDRHTKYEKQSNHITQKVVTRSITSLVFFHSLM